MANSRIFRLTGAVNGINKNFSTPTQYVNSTVRVILNGQVYESDDTKWGWTESAPPTGITLVTAPRTGDEVQAFYEEIGGAGLQAVKGSPFAPGECGA